MSKNVILILLFCLFSLVGCSKYYLSLRQVPVDGEYLASTHVGSPDPRQLNPPFGQKVVMEWVVPPELLSQKPRLVLHLIYRDHTQEKMSYRIKSRKGMEVFSLLNEEYLSKKGILTYRAEIRNNQGVVYREWTHQLWVQLINFPQEASSSAAFRTRNSVVSQPMQGSVIETP